jgi:arylsulfatase A-like enzyme
VQRTGPPNIVFLVADDLGWVDLSSDLPNDGNGSSYYQTPNIDRLADEGMSFTRAYALQNCQPTRAALFSGQYAPVNGVYNVRSLDRGSDPSSSIVPPAQRAAPHPDGISLTEMLKIAGYTTAFFGKNHGTGQRVHLGRNLGIDLNRAARKLVSGTVGGVATQAEYHALDDDLEGWIFSIPELTPYARPYDAAYISEILEPVANGNDPRDLLDQPKHFTDAITDAAVDYIGDHGGGPRPFFLYMAFHAVHSPIVPRDDLRNKYAALTSSDPRHGKPDYAAFVEGLDQSVGRILGALDDPNGDGDTGDSIAATTLVIFYSDNGGNVGQTDNAPLRRGKGTFFEGGIRVPLICRLPGLTRHGSVSHQSVHAIDFYPTLAELAVAPLPDPSEYRLDGESFAPILAGDRSELDRDALFWHFPGYMDTRQRPSSVIQKRVADRHYKLFYYYEDGAYALYDLSEDVGESHNLLAGEPAPADLALARELNNELRSWLIETDAATGTWRASGQPVPLPPEDMAR